MPDASISWDAATGDAGQWPSAAAHPPTVTGPATNAAEGQSPDNPRDQHAPLYPTDAAADNAPAVEPGQNPQMPAAVPVPVQQGGSLDQPKPGMWDTLKGAFDQSFYGSVYEHTQHPDAPAADDVPGYDPYTSGDMKGYENNMDDFTHVHSPEQARVVKDRIDDRNAAQDITNRAGWEGHVANLGFGIVDPVTLSMMVIPGAGELGVTTRLGRIALGAATNVGIGEAMAGATAEPGHYTDNIGTRIVTDALAGGVLGALTRSVPKAELDAAKATTHEEVTEGLPGYKPPIVPEESTAGAAAVHETTLEQESIARGGRFIANTVGRVSPMDRLMTQSEEPETRRLAQQLVDPGYMIEKNKQDIPTPPSVEMRVNQQENARNLQIVKQLDQQFSDYKQSGGQMDRGGFSAAIADAMNNGDAHEIPEVGKFAKWMRPMLDNDNSALSEVGVPMPEQVTGAKSYLPWVWDKYAVLHNQPELQRVLTDWFTANPKRPEMAAARGVTAEAGAVGDHSFKSANGELIAQENGKYLQALRNDTAEGARGKGEGTQRHIAMITEAEKRGLTAASDKSVSPDAAKLYAKLKKQGYEVTQNPSEINPETGNLVSTTGQPVFEVKSPGPQYREPAEVTAAVRDTMDHIMGQVHGTADLGIGVKNPNVMKPRSLDLPWELRKKFMSTDVEHILKSYNHTVLPQLEMRRQFGTPDMADQLQNISDRYRVKIQAAGEDKEAVAALTQRHAKDIDDLTLLRDRVLNQTGSRLNESRSMVRAAQLVRTFNYERMLGGQTLSAPPDLGRLVVRYGLARTMGRYAQYLSGAGKGLMREDAQKMGTAADVVLHTRQSTLDGIGDEMAGSDKVARFARDSSNAFTKWTGIAAWDSMMRTLSSQLEQDALHGMLTKENPSEYEIGLMNSHGISTKDLPAIQKEWAQHGSSEFGLNRARTELWGNQTAARKVELAVQRAASASAFFVGKGDMPRFANSEIGKMLVQFKAFALSSVNRLAIPLAQGLAHRDIHAANGAAALMALGGLSYYLKELAAGRQPDLNPKNLAIEAANRSGILTYAPDVYDPIAGMLHLPRFSKFQDLDPTETLLGPTGGTIAQLMGTVGNMSHGIPSAQDFHKLRQLVPWNNVFYLNRLSNAIEGRMSNDFGLRGAKDASFGDYLNPAQDAATQRPRTDNKHLFGIEQIPNQF